MPDTPACPTCGSPVPPGSPGGACPRCLLAAGLESGPAADRAAPPTPEEMARHFPGLEILEVLGQGGMGIVYRARHRNLDRMVALKVLPPEAAREPSFPERFTREARTLARLHHPHIVGVHDFGETGGLYWLVMEYVDGPNLRQVIREGSLEPKQALAIVPQVCDALQYAHDQGIVHRDIKPENILLDREGQVKIADFGLARIVQRAPVDLTLTREGQVLGTLHYMAPEQYRSPDTVDHRADIYSLGVVFYEMLTGELPMGVFPPPSRRLGVDARLDGVVMRALEKERDQRWQHASDVRTQVDSIAAGPAPAADAAEAAPAPDGKRTREEDSDGGVRLTIHKEWKDGDPDAPLSRMAVVAGLGVPLAFALGAAGWAITEALTHGTVEEELCPRVAAITAGATLLFTAVLGIVSWIRIHHAAGRLRGLSWAMAGTFLNPFVLCAGVPAAFLLEPGNAPMSGEHPDFGGLRGDRIPPMAAEGVRGRAHSVLGGPLTMSEGHREWIVREMDDLWRAAGAGLLHQAYLAGEEGKVPSAWSVRYVALSPDGWSGRVVVSDGKRTLAFPVAHDGQGWSVPEGDREEKSGPPAEGDRDGRILDGAGASRKRPITRPADAALVTLATPGMTEEDRADLVTRLRATWARSGAEFLRTRFPGTERALRFPGMRLHAVVLRADGLVGRMVLTDGSAVVAVPIAPGIGFWEISDDPAEWLDRPADDTDLDGFLGGPGPGGGGWPSPPAGARTPVPPDAGGAVSNPLPAPPILVQEGAVRGGPIRWTDGDRAEAGASFLRYWAREGRTLLAAAMALRREPGQVDAPAQTLSVFLLYFDATGRTARVVLTGPRDTIAFVVERTGEDWSLLEKGQGIVHVPRTAGPEWLDPKYGPRQDPPAPDTGGGTPTPPDGGGGTPTPPSDPALAADACLVHGLPAGRSAAELAAVARAVRALWREKGPEYVRKTVPSPVPAGAPARIPGNAADYTLFAVALEEGGRTGRAVLGNGTVALSVPVERDGEVWVLGESGWESRFSPPGKADEDGHLFR